MRLLLFLLLLLGFGTAQDLYREFIKSQVKEIPLNKAIVAGKGKRELITFINPDCGHCRKEWQALKPHMDKLKVYVFLLPFRSFPESYAKSNYIACSKDKLKALEEVLSGVWDGNPPQVGECPLVKEHTKVAEKLNIQSTPYNIVLGSYKVIEGYSPKLLEELGIK
ncbi:MAG: DsbC family protein [Aquificaceae bacterium]|nr:DsbC family protein [Aquificaceae bacterium]MCS7195987.1 DsbC family protein [Aquificaceae bacterium]MCX7989257.1 DsbC family protein [Aquificaceae bacterium]MDW8032977.1 DsbC family protein [Aquificaceae bacterium]MDW8294275.1 DsbC family protein [Aquificaceae bacterium]